LFGHASDHGDQSMKCCHPAGAAASCPQKSPTPPLWGACVRGRLGDPLKPLPSLPKRRPTHPPARHNSPASSRSLDKNAPEHLAWLSAGPSPCVSQRPMCTKLYVSVALGRSFESLQNGLNCIFARCHLLESVDQAKQDKQRFKHVDCKVHEEAKKGSWKDVPKHVVSQNIVK